jgi:hypothetical protein
MLIEESKRGMRGNDCADPLTETRLALDLSWMAKSYYRTHEPPDRLQALSWLTGRRRCPTGFKTAFGEIDLLLAARANVLLIKLIGKDFLLFAAFRTLANKRTQVLETLPTRAMLRCSRSHSSLSFIFPLLSSFNCSFNSAQPLNLISN